MKQMLSAAIKFAVEKHDGQFDKGGNPYITHCLKVMHYLKSDDEELMCIAVLHDVVEDCYQESEWYDKGIMDLFAIGMSNRVVDGVICMSHPKNESYDRYIRRISVNIDCTRVKMADLRHNMDIRRLKDISEKDLNRLAKYAKAYHYLEGE